MSPLSHCLLSAVNTSSESSSKTEKSGLLAYPDLIQRRDWGPPCHLCGVPLGEHREVILSVRDAQVYLCPPSALT